ncbi:MAG: diversity-generating retroelement protein Avd [Thiohalocapsa sp. PB-PSB1]|jgi:hypothetical protein|nr:MAG: diversity-generating retroelement protein Avd [Thiohalocapsa sp. PB-PSB1]
MAESPVFAKSYALLHWLIPIAIGFPRSHRFVLAERIQRCALDFHETLIAAAKAKDSLSSLHRADLILERLRFELRLAHDLGILSHGQYHHAAGMLAEVGRLLGAWIKRDNEGRVDQPN